MKTVIKLEFDGNHWMKTPYYFVYAEKRVWLFKKLIRLARFRLDDKERAIEFAKELCDINDKEVIEYVSGAEVNKDECWTVTVKNES